MSSPPPFPSPAPPPPAPASGPVMVTGRARTAGWLVTAGGIAILVAAFLPWFRLLGIFGAVLPVGYFLAFGAAGTLIGFLGVRALFGRVTRAKMAWLWVLSLVAAYVAVGLFWSAHDVTNESFGAVTPASGFYIGILGLVSTVFGTVLLQTTRPRPAPRPAAGPPGA